MTKNQAPENTRLYDEILAPKRKDFATFVDISTGPVLAIAAHFFIIGLFGPSIFCETKKKDKADIEVYIQNVEIQEFEEPQEIPQSETSENNNDSDLEESIEEVEAEDISTDDLEVVYVEDIETTDIQPLNKSNDTICTLPTDIELRANSNFRSKMIKKYNSGGGASSKKIEARTKLALNWLANNQNKDGSWGTGNTRYESKIALSSLATLTFLAHGETPTSEHFGKVVLNATKYLTNAVNKRKKSENINPQHNWIVEGGGRGYGNAMLAYALSEAYAVTKLPMVKQAMNKQIDCIIKAQNEEGSWNYNYVKKTKYLEIPGSKTKKKVSDPKGDIIARSDLSLAGWHYQALKAAYTAGCANSKLPKAIEKSIFALKKYAYIENGEWGYSNATTSGEQVKEFNPGNSFSMSSVGILCLQLFGETDCDEVKKGMKFLTSNKNWLECNWKKAGAVLTGEEKDYINEETAVWALYAWYYYTQALFQGEKGRGQNWRKWNSSFSKELMAEQNPEGYWVAPAHKYSVAGIGTLGEQSYVFYSNKAKTSISRGGFASKKSRKPTNEASKDLKIYSTTLCTLMLTVYYRYLPSSKLESYLPHAIPIKKEPYDDLGLFF